MTQFNKDRLMDSPDWPKVRNLISLLIECRDALPAISTASARLHSVSLSLADRIDEELKPWEVSNDP
jgi:hypothetical protein